VELLHWNSLDGHGESTYRIKMNKLLFALFAVTLIVMGATSATSKR